MLRNTTDRYGLIAKLLHWSIALLILGLIWLGWWMVDLTYFDPWYNRSLEWHKAFGMIVLALALAKLVWLHVSPSPPLAGPLPRWQRIAAKATHHTLIAMMLLLPITGYVISTSDGKSVDLFGAVQLPALWSRNETLRNWAIEVHFYAAYATALLALVHAAAALKHQFYNRDGTLARMLWR